MQRSLAALALLAAAACGGARPAPTTASTPDAHPLAFLAAERVIVTPTFTMSVAPALGWAGRLPRAKELLRTMDGDIATVLAERGLRRGWILPQELSASYTRNQTYATDPYSLAEEPLRSPMIRVGNRLPEPLASQLRTMIALHENARLVLVPIELRLESAAPGAATGRAALRLTLVDPRLSEVRWIGEVKSDTSSTPTPQMTATLARRLVDLVAPGM